MAGLPIKPILISFGVGVLFIILVVTVVLFSRDSQELEKKTPITFDEFLDNKFQSIGYNGSWLSNDQILWRDVFGNIVKFDVKNQIGTHVLSKETLDKISNTVEYVSFSTLNPNLLLLRYNIQKIYRHSTLAHYVVINTQTNETTFVLNPPKLLQYVTWLPNKNTLVFVDQNNIGLLDIEKPSETPTYITTDGQESILYNGVPDWVYEEEVLEKDNALYVSPNGENLAFAQFNDTLVQRFEYSKYGRDPEKNQYSETIGIYYPKAGTTNPVVKLLIYSNKELKEPKLPDEIEGLSDRIFVGADWIQNDLLYVRWMNRIQSVSYIMTCDISTEISCRVFDKEQATNGWLNPAHNPFFHSDGKSFVQIRSSPPDPNSNLTYYRVVHKKEGGNVSVISSQNSVSVLLLKWSLANDLYFIGTKTDLPGTRALYVLVNLNSEKCLSCSRCDHVTVELDSNYYIETCSSPSQVPKIYIRDYKTHKEVFTLSSNSKLSQLLSTKVLPNRIDLMISVGDEFKAPVKLFLPSEENFDENKKYPLIIHVYGGPGSQMINYQFSAPSWPEYLVTSRNIVYGVIDGRGTGFQSIEYMTSIYQKLGTFEITDQINVTKQLLQKYPYLDEKKIGIWGWSYGGYATLMTLSQDFENVFSCGISVAPPTDWTFYDSLYTERYMNTPDNNREGYKNSSVLEAADNLKNKKFVIHHGSGDDNVHYQNYMFLTRVLEEKDIQFEQHSYPDENHSLLHVKKFLYHSMDIFWLKCFKSMN